MPKITYIENSEKTHTIEVSNGLSVMEGAIQNDIPGIDADCGGAMACATCLFMSKKNGLISFQKKMMEKKICWIWLMNQISLVD